MELRAFGAVVFLLLVEAGACFLSGTPSLISPTPMPLIVPILWGVPFPLVLALPILIFWVWVRPLRSGRSVGPRKTWFLFLATGALSSAWFVSGWNYGLRYQGGVYTRTTAGLSAVLGSIVLVLLLRGKDRSTPSLGLVTQSLLFAWIVSYAFPWLGELP
jgi:hypothetical protein